MKNIRLKFFISPFFLTKLYFYRKTKELSTKYSFNGKVIDIGCGVKPYKHLFSKVNKYEGIDFKSFSDNDSYKKDIPEYFFSKEYLEDFILPFKNESYENVFAFQVLEHHANPNKFISEMFRITKKNGYILLTVPFLGGIHEGPHDYQRYTKYGLLNLFKEYSCEVQELISIGSFFSTISMLCNEHLCNIANRGKFQYVISAIFYIPFLFFQYLSYFLDKIVKSDHIVKGYILLVQKN